MREDKTLGAWVLASAMEEEADEGPVLTEDQLSAEFNAIISETNPVDVETDDLHEADWMFDEDDCDES